MGYRLENESYLDCGYRLYKDKELHNLTNLQIADILNEQFDMKKDESAHRKYFVSYIKGYDFAIDKQYDKNSTQPRLVISDLHLPFAVDGWLEFIKATHAKYNCQDEIIINGDLLDLHQFSFHTSETDAMSGNDEFEKAKLEIARLSKEFPNAIFVEGNHDLIMVRKMKEVGIDKRYLKTFHQLLDLPNTWKVVDQIIIDEVLYKHIPCCGGKTSHIMSAISNRMSTVSSHLHADGGVGYATSPMGETIFGLNTGALVDDASYALRYGKHSRFKATLGCGVVVNKTEAHFIPFKR